jgi:hypothetical protein
MSDNELIDFDPNEYEGDWDPLIPDKEQEQPERSGSESSGGSDDEEDEVQITYDPQLPNEVSLGSNARKSNQSKTSYVMRRKTMNEVVYIPKITTKSDDWATILARGSKELPGMFSPAGQQVVAGTAQ